MLNDVIDETDRSDPETTPADRLALRHPGVPVTLADLAARKAEGIEIIEARGVVLSTARKIGLRLTSPPDWVLFKAPEEHGGQIVGYLQDAGCERVRDVTGIEIFDVSTPEKVVGAEPGQFHYIIRGSGRCKLTGQTVETMEGGRSSTDDFVKGKTGVELELLIRKAARANLDGNIVRELAGMKAVPVEDLESAWVGTHKKVGQCRLGRGFGTHEERLGASSAKAPDVEPPVCPHCGTTGAYRPAKWDRKPFYGCPKFASHADKKWIVDAAKWVAEHSRSVNETPTPAAATGAPPSAGEVFGKSAREPGAEG